MKSPLTTRRRRLGRPGITLTLQQRATYAGCNEATPVVAQDIETKLRQHLKAQKVLVRDTSGKSSIQN